MKEIWRLVGFDEFDGEYYPLEGEYPSEQEAQNAGVKRLEGLEITQPTETSGGQRGIQDRVFVQKPDGSRYRFNPPINRAPKNK